MRYRIREVDGCDDVIIDTINELDKAVASFPPIKTENFENGYWWLVYAGAEPIAYAGIVPSQRWLETGYLARAGVLPEHRGRGLQRRLMAVRERKAKAIGWKHIVSDCTSNIPSANNFIKCGYELYQPSKPWAFANTLYWRKSL